MGFEIEANVPATITFAVACVLWWVSYKIARSANGRGMTLGFVALSMWMLNLVGALLSDFHHYITAVFFWVSTTLSALVLVSIVLCPPQLIFAFCIDCEVVGWNVALYAAVGAVVVGLRKKPK